MAPIFGRWPWPRVALSFAIDFLKRAPAKVVAVDLSLAERDRSRPTCSTREPDDKWSAQQSDRALADSAKTAGNVIMLADAVYEGIVGGDEGRGRRDVARIAVSRRPAGASRGRWCSPPYQGSPTPPPRSATTSSTRDDDGPARRMPPFIVSDGKELPSLGVAAALLAGGFQPEDVRAEGSVLRIGDRRVPLVRRRIGGHDQWTMLINYRAPALVRNSAGELERPYPSYEFRAAVRGRAGDSRRARSRASIPRCSRTRSCSSA